MLGTLLTSIMRLASWVSMQDSHVRYACKPVQYSIQYSIQSLQRLCITITEYTKVDGRKVQSGMLASVWSTTDSVGLSFWKLFWLCLCSNAHVDNKDYMKSSPQECDGQFTPAFRLNQAVSARKQNPFTTTSLIICQPSNFDSTFGNDAVRLRTSRFRITLTNPYAFLVKIPVNPK